MIVIVVVFCNVLLFFDFFCVLCLSCLVCVVLLLLVMVVGVVLFCVLVVEVVVEQVWFYVIFVGQLGDVFNCFVCEVGIIFLVILVQIGGYSFQGLCGSFIVQQGLVWLFVDILLEVEDQGDGSFVLCEVLVKDGDVLNMQVVEVFVFGNNLGSIDGYLVIYSQIVIKISKLLLEISQIVLVIICEQIDDIVFKIVQQVMCYIFGIFIGQVGVFNCYDYVVMCGFVDNSVDNIYFDGFKVMGDSGIFSLMQVDLYFFECIDVFKGLFLVFYGCSLLGGLVVLISKKLLYEDYCQIIGSIGNMGQKEMGFDFSGLFDEEKCIVYCLVGFGKGLDIQFDYVKEECYVIVLILVIDFSDDIILIL